ncbi:hypothetical protein RSOLAG1IB_12203 [Rhizoctonia solani AG-1 IB]|uniref:Uncharacterized protein n=1 Tax=Thanatephorus cucumeris (strain AG1-IB / isolate 7/3/14) TaxID=1108050 RepID=A0A0B7FRJ7_THACB|nr:hypothetical protein RSOLAG1IB_12203 [Rhizoctonia solani AG-1 IB]
MRVNRVTSFQNNKGPRGSSKFLLLNICPDEHNRHSLWVCLGNSTHLDEHKGTACIANGHRCVMEKESNIIEDIALNPLHSEISCPSLAPSPLKSPQG